jgi:hypothetical protein
LVEKRIDEIMDFVNTIRREYEEEYGWKPENREYFLKDLVDKWAYSFAIIDNSDLFYLINFSSVYGDVIHNHCTYTIESKRNSNLAKFHMLKLCQIGLDNGYDTIEGYFPKNNSGSIALHLKMGWEIQSVRNNKDLLLRANLESVRNTIYEILIQSNSYIDEHTKRIN